MKKHTNFHNEITERFYQPKKKTDWSIAISEDQIVNKEQKTQTDTTQNPIKQENNNILSEVLNLIQKAVAVMIILCGVIYLLG